MSYLGNAPARSFISFERQVFTIVNSQTAYALSHSVTNENDIRLVVNNVVQEPGSGKAYTATGTALTLSAALTNGTDEMYCVFLGRATATSAPGAGSIGTAQLADLNVTSGKIANDAVTLAKMASGTDGNIISYDASGNPVAVATGNDGQVLTSAGAGAPPVFETLPVGGKIGQVIQTVKTNTASHNSQSYTDVSGMSVSITPSASNSKILVIVDARMGITNNYSALGRIVRGSTAIYVGDSAGNRTQGFTGPNSDENRDIHNFVATFLDSPSSTNSVTYKLQTLTQDSSATIDINRTINDTNNNYDGRFASSITVMEVLA